ncbi:MAG: hypothetical protein J6R59_10225 [Paludibacteraceae bacterium]|nr:hypothetical protein [Paludibacteraceae bacterium]
MTKQDKYLKETMHKLAASIPTQTKERFDAQCRFENETNEIIERFSNIGKKEYIRGKRADLSVLNDYSGVPQEIIDEVCKPFINNRG